MLTQAKINKLKTYPGLGWISALRFTAIRDLVEKDGFQPSLFDKPNLAEFTSEHRPNLSS
jgi:hypothetical protein